MATTIQLLRSDIAQQRPDPGVLANGVPMVNIHESEPGLFFAARNGTLFKVGPAAVGPLAPNLFPQGSTGNTLGEMWVDTSGSNPELKFYDGASWEPCFAGLSGTVTSVGLSLPDIFSVSNSPVTTSGNLTASLSLQNANRVFAGPESGSAAAPSFRSLAAVDIPSLPSSKITSGVFDSGRIPSLDASKISSGVFSSARIPTIAATGVSYTRADTGAATTTVQLRLQESVSVKDFGATGDGSTDDTTNIQEAINAAAAGQAIELPPGVYKVGSLTFNGPVIFNGGQLDSTGTVTFKSPITAPLGRIFRGGTYVFDCVIVGYPEWWGGGTSESGGPATGVTNQAAIMACYIACHTTQLQVGTYLTSGTIYLETSGRTLRGAANYWRVSGYNGTRIVILSASNDVIFLRTDTLSTDNTTYVRNVRIEYLELSRSSSTGAAALSVGLRTYKIIYCEFHKIRSSQHYRPYYISGNIASVWSECQAFGSVALKDPTATYSGWYLDGSVSVGLAGGNASVTLNSCTGSTGGSTQAAVRHAFHLTSRYVDTFLIQPEAVGIDIGIFVEGDLSEISPTDGQQDVHIMMPILDAFRRTGILIKDQKSAGSIEINGGYCAPAAGWESTITSCLDFVNTRGQISVSNFECYCNPLRVTPGLKIDSASRGISITNLKVIRSKSPVIIDGSYNFVQVTSSSDDETGTDVVEVTGDRNVISLGAWGNVAAAFTNGVNVSGDRNEISVTRVDPAVVTNVITNTGSNNVIVGYP